MQLSLDEGAGGVASDGSGNDHHGSIHGASWTSDAAPVPGDSSYALRCDGVDDYVDLGLPATLRDLQSFSISAWFKSSSVDRNYTTLVSRWWSGGSPNRATFTLGWTNGGLGFSLQDDATGGVGAGRIPGLGDSQWHHVVATYDHETRTASLYMDGKCPLQGRNPAFRGPDMDTAEPIRICSDNRYAHLFNDRLFNGQVDEVRIYNHVLGQTDVAMLFGGAVADDADQDGIPSACDNCAAVANADQADYDADRAGDSCDNCPGLANGDQRNSDGDGYGDACDNCPYNANDDQANLDGDGMGDACDDDDDNDGILDASDNCPLVVNVDQADFDNDGTGDACDVDIDGDGVDNELDRCPATTVDAQVVDVEGCSGEQLVDEACPCSSGWKNHGQYVACVAKAADAAVASGLLTEAEKDALVASRASSGCGRKK